MTEEQLKSKFDEFLALADANVASKPWLVVMLMHEYFRSIFPTDPYLPFDKKTSHTARISATLDNGIQAFKSLDFFGSYFDQKIATLDKVSEMVSDTYRDRKDEDQTQKVYGRLWDKFNVDNYLKETHELIKDRFKNTDFDFESLKGKKVLDLGCGSGRFAIALAMLGAGTSYGIDLGKASIENCRAIAKKVNLNNVHFDVGSVLDLPYEDNTFDFIFCNGVLHHTTDMEKGIQEMYRVLKSGAPAFLYLYADGGIYWYSRKRMQKVIKKIPQAYTMAVLDLIGMPQDRFIFSDNWYVPNERHSTRDFLEDYLTKVGFKSLKKIVSDRTTDLDRTFDNVTPEEQKAIWGDGEHRYMMSK